MSLFPLVTFDQINLETANRLLVLWQHQMGPLNRPMNGGLLSGGGDVAHGLQFEGEFVAVTTTSSLIRENVAGFPHLNRSNTVELSRLCACRPGLCRVALRLWREFVFAPLGIPWAISYQDHHRHTGDVYRFDGWTKIGASRSGPDRRSGRKGRNKRIWLWPKPSSPLAPLVSQLSTLDGSAAE